MRRRKVPNVMRSGSKISRYNIANDNMADMKKHYGWSERQLEANVRGAIGSQAPRSEIQAGYDEAYKRKS